MTGGSGLGQRVLASARSPAARAVAGALDGLQVNRDNVLHAHNVLKKEAVELSSLMQYYGQDLHVGPCGKDPISDAATRAFNAKIAAFADQCAAYVDALKAAAEVLRRTAQDYGYTEFDIVGSFAKFLSSSAEPGAADQIDHAPQSQTTR